MTMNDSDPLFPADFPVHLRRFARHITAVQTRGTNNSSTNLLFTSIPSNSPQPPPNYVPAYDSYDLKSHPIKIFRPNLFVDNIERLFVSVVPLWSAGINEVTRLTTWREPSRTTSWAIVYSICWWNELVLPAVLMLIICLSAWPKHSAAILFPSEKLAPSTLDDGAGNQTEPEGEEAAQVAAAAAATFIHNDDDSPLPPVSPIAEVCPNLSHTTPVDHSSPHSDSNNKSSTTSSKSKETKNGKKNLTQQYKPVIYKYGGGIQNIAGELCDVHERLRNLFTRRFIPPPPQLLLNPSLHSQNTTPEIDANVRFALPFIPLLFFSLALSTETLGRCITFALGFVFFFLNPIKIRVKLVQDALDADQTILRGVPTDRAFVLATLRNMQQRHEAGLDIAMKLLAKPKPPKLPKRKRTLDDQELDPNASLSDLSSTNITPSSLRSVSSIPDLTHSCDLSSSSQDTSPGAAAASAASPPPELHKKLIKFAKKINRVTEQGTQLWSRATLYPSLDLSNFLSSNKSSSRKVIINETETASVKSSSKADKLFKAITASRSINLNNLSTTGTMTDDGDSVVISTTTTTNNNNIPISSSNMNGENSSSSFFCYYGNMPGHLTIHFSRSMDTQPMLSFYSGLGQSFKVRKSLIVIPLSRIVGMRKVSMLNLAGVWGGIDGIQICERRSTTTSSSRCNNNNHETPPLLLDDSLPSSSTTNTARLTFKSLPKFKHHTFRNISKRDEAFLRLLVLKDWEDDEEPGWIAV